MDKSKFTIRPLNWDDDFDLNGRLNESIAYSLHAPFQIDFYFSDDDEPYHAQQNNLDDDCFGESFATLEEAKAHCQALHEKQVMAALEFVEVEDV